MEETHGSCGQTGRVSLYYYKACNLFALFTCQLSTETRADARAVRPYMHSSDNQLLTPCVSFSAIS